jgi:flagellar hook-associated protein 2
VPGEAKEKVMGISVTTGIASGIDYDAIIEATLDVEQVKIDNYETKKETFQSEISALGEVKSKLSAFQDAVDDLADSWDFFEYSASSSDEGIVTTNVTDDAAAGTYRIEVTQLAAPEIVIGSDGFSSGSDTVGGGTINIKVGSEDAVDITIDSDSTLSEIKSAINGADAGVTASIVEVSDDSYALMVTADENGESISFTIDDDDGVDTDASGLSSIYSDPSTSSMDVAQTGTLAQFTMGDVTFESSSNDIDGLIEGVTLSLNSAESGTTVTIQVETDSAAMSDKMQTLVDSYNSLITLLDEYQDEGDEESYGILFGDATTNNLRSSLYSNLFSKIDNGDSEYAYLSNLGVEVQDDGSLTFDTDTFEEALADDADGVQAFFTTADTGFADMMNETLDAYLDWDGIFATKIDGLESSVDRVDKKIEYLEDKLDIYEERLRTRYAALETLLSELTGTQASLDSLLGSLDSGS